MKVIFAVAALAAVVAVVYGAPVINDAPDWTIVSRKVNEVESAIVAAVGQINTVAKQDNPTVGADIERKLGARAIEARAVLAQARTAIESRSLNEDSAKAFFATLRTILGNAQADITPDVQKLSPAVQQQIRDILANNLTAVERIAEEIYAELRKLAATFAPDWTVVGRKVNDVEAAITAAVQQINAVAKQDNPTVGADIERKLGARAIEARAVLAQARAAIESRSLNEDSAKAFFATLRTILGNAQTDITPDVQKLSPAVQQQIRDILANNLTTVERIANEIYAELRKLAATFAPDWTVVGRKVNEVESAITAAVQQINTVAKQDNPTVGADIERKLGARAIEARAVLAQARAAIESRSLNEDSAKAFFATLRTILGNAQTDITPDVQKLSPAVQQQIRDTLASNLTTVERIANEIYAELRKLAATFAPDWTVVSRKVNDVEAAIVAAVGQINTVAKQDNPTVGADIERKLGARAVEARAVLAQARTAIESRSLNEDSAKAFFATLRTILGNAQTDITPDVQKLSPAVQQQIRDILANNLTAVERIAEEIYAELRK